MSTKPARSLRIGGITPMTTIDYPGELAAVVFCQGCPWRCRYCHNAHLLNADGSTTIEWAEVLQFLTSRQGLLDAVVFSGGEPTAQSALPEALMQMRDMGFKTGLHTAGAYPDRLRRVLPLLDWIGLDIKALPEDYSALTGAAESGERAWRSLEHLLDSGIPHDVRVTIHEGLLPRPKREALLIRLRAAGVRSPVLQTCRDRHMLDPSLGQSRAFGEVA